MRWQKVTLIGVGLLGGSLGLALCRRKLAREVVGLVRRPASVRECVGAGAVHAATLDLAEAVAGAQLVVLCTPIARMKPLMEQMRPAVAPGAVITDVGSVKAGVVRELEPLARRAGAWFVGSHPMAGAEKMGVSAARADLFEGAVCVVTPTRRTRPAALRQAEGLWRGVGARVLRLTPQVHDRLVSRTSHLPHVLAAALVNLVLSPGGSRFQPMLCANGFRDTTRIASGSPEMWRDIALANRIELARALGRFARELQRLHQRVVRGEAAALEAYFSRAKARRDLWQAGPAPTSPE